MKIPFKLLSSEAKVPRRGSEFAAGYDLFTTDTYELKPGERHLYKTNVSLAIPVGYYGRIAPRSGLAYKKGIDTLAGVIDADYRGDIGVILINFDSNPFTFNKDEPIAQIIIEKYHDVEFEVTTELPKSVRSEGGFGSTDIKEKSTLLEKLKTVPSSQARYETVIREREKQLSA